MRPTGNLPFEMLRISLAQFLNVRLRARRDRHRSGAQAREAQGEAVGTAEAEGVTVEEQNNNMHRVRRMKCNPIT